MTNWGGIKTCTACGVAKPYTQFWRNRTKSDGLRSECIPCASEVNLRRPVVKARLSTVPPSEAQAIADAYGEWSFPVEPSRLFATVAPLFVPDPPDAFIGQAANP